MTIGMIGILAGVAGYSMLDFSEDGRYAATVKKLTTIKTMVRGNPTVASSPGYLKDMGRYPSTLAELVNITSNCGADTACGTSDDELQPQFSPYSKRGWRGPYINQEYSKDEWGNSFQYDATTKTVKSCGKDGLCGGPNAADDVFVDLDGGGDLSPDP